MEIIKNEAILKIAAYSEWILAMENAMKDSLSGKIVVPKRMHLDHNNDTFLLMPCITDDYWSTKLVSFCPGNKESGRPSIYGTVVLNNSKTGEPLAVLDGITVTAMRTAAVTAAGIKILSPANSRSLGIVGTGTQGVYQALFACSVRKINVITAYDHNKDSLIRFRDEINFKFPDIKISVAADSDEVAKKSEVIITATNSKNPVFTNKKELFSGKTFIGIGSYKPDCMEFPEQLFRQVDQIFVDTTDGKNESGDLINPVKNKWIKEENIYPMGMLISGNIGLSPNQTRLFKTVGSAVFDLYAAKLIYEMYTSVTNG
jgi:ornithine cyclodeaminase/alanine dehydrogenase-like protein (mu-crystallin family)